MKLTPIVKCLRFTSPHPLNGVNSFTTVLYPLHFRTFEWMSETKLLTPKKVKLTRLQSDAFGK